MKKAFRKICMFSLASLMLLGLAACGGSPAPAEGEDAAAEGDAAKGKTYTIYSDTAFAPFEYLDIKTNKYIGFDMDLLAAIAEDQGFKYTVENVGFEASESSVQAGQADAMIAGMTINDARKEKYDFSNGYFVDGQIMAVKKGSDIATFEDLKGKTVATKASTEGYKYAMSIKDEYGFEVKVYEDSPTMYNALTQGIDVACFEDRTVVEWAIKSGDLELETVGNVLNPKEYGFAVKKGSFPELIEMFNAGLASLKENGKYDELMAKYGF